METEFKISFNDGAVVEIVGENNLLYDVKFYNDDNGELIHSSKIGCGYWTKTSIKYFIRWRVVIEQEGKEILVHKYDCKDKYVRITSGSDSLGDNMAWIPYFEEFRKKHECKVVVYSKLGKFFQKYYPEIIWLESEYGITEYDPLYYASYKVSLGISIDKLNEGIKKLNKLEKLNKMDPRRVQYIEEYTFYDKERHLEHPALIPLQRNSSNTLGLEPKELRPVYKSDQEGRPIEGKYVCFSEFASADGMKIWNNRIGWKTVIEELQSLGYEVVSISKERTKYNVTQRNGNYSLDDRIWYLNHCEFFIGSSSGLSWLAWAAGAKTVLISGHTKEWYEPKENVIRIINKEVCNGCHNEEEHADKFCCYHFLFCPSNKNFICTRAISPRMVMDAIRENGLIKLS